MSPPRPEIAVSFFVDDDLPGAWDEARLRELVARIVDKERGGGWAISLHLVSDETIRALNDEHRGIDNPTDVLSFPLTGDDFALPPDEAVQLGDVVVSYPRAVEQAHAYGHSLEREIAYLVAHGVLHILGYDHEDPEQQKVMRQREEEALEPLGYLRPA